MNIIIFLVIGILVGWLAGVIVKGHGLGTLGDMVVGVIGSFVGGFIFDIFGLTSYGSWGAFVTSVIGAVIFLFLVGLFAGPSRSQRIMGKL